MIIDAINDLEFNGGSRLLKPALGAARRIARLHRRAHEAGAPVIYANDNAGRWRSDFSEVVRHCLEDGVRGEPLAALLRPGPRDYFVLKPRHSAFFETPLGLLLNDLKVEELILTGFSADSCVLFTASDAYLRGFRLRVPSDCTASETRVRTRQALNHMARILRADTKPSRHVPFRRASPHG